MSVDISNPNGFSGSGFVSNNRTNDGLLKVHGVALGENDITRGHLSGERKLWKPEVLRGSAETLEGKDIVVNHENKSAYEKVGEITDAGYKDGIGVIYQGVIMSDELEPKIERGWLDVSPRIVHSKDSEEITENTKAPNEIFDFPNLSIVRKGASHSNELLPGEHEELSVDDIKAEFDDISDDTIIEYHSSVEELQESDIDLREHLYDSRNAAIGASEDLGCEGAHTAVIEGNTWYLPCSSRDSLLRNVSQKQSVEEEEEELQRSEARTPEYDGTEETSWADVSKDMSYWADALGYDDVGSVDDLSEEQKSEIASHTLLGESEGDTWEEISYFPVVNPNTSNLNRGALEAVRSGRGQSADIPQSTYESAYATAGRLLNEEFDSDVKVEMEEGQKNKNPEGEVDEAEANGDPEPEEENIGDGDDPDGEGDGIADEFEESDKYTKEEMRLASELASYSELRKDECLGIVTSLKGGDEYDIGALAKMASSALGCDYEEMREHMEEMATDDSEPEDTDNEPIGGRRLRKILGQ